ncbi:ATP-binding protein [Streptomyces sp. NBC_01619]|uniref:AAA family ATPase n=1 Tax=Streptomyces sp. NBC_01619 TaxID=2975901 RepID=UPI002255643F|nr:AAA family ATPase [Streptomyces sp. NBC_01619]MCX4515917.1 ATP-binding protein [Streptomyces sp. NBC_01619]
MTAPAPVRIGVLGTHSTGKTTLLKRIEMELRSHGVTVGRTGRLAKRAAGIGLPKMQHHTQMSTEWIICQSAADEIAAVAQGAQVVLADRAVHDAFAYYTAALEFRGEHPDLVERERLLLLAATQAPKYDLLLATVLDPDILVDQSHDYDARYRSLVDQHVHGLLRDEKLEHLRVTSDADSKTSAIQLAVETGMKAVAA